MTMADHGGHAKPFRPALRHALAVLAWLATATLPTPIEAQPVTPWRPEAVAALQGVVDRLPEHGLDPRHYAIPAPATGAAIEALALELAADLTVGRQGSAVYGAEPREAVKVRLRQPLRDALVSPALAIPAFYATLPPQDATYGVLQRGLAGETDPARRQALTATLERRRWLPRGTPARLLLVNIPAYELTFYEAGALVTVHPVIVGQPAHPTPLMQVAAPGITLNPWWNVPDRIAREKLWPKLRRDPRFAASMGYVIDNGRIRQKPGPKNALGQLKFVMPNGLDVYLHDTPDKALFDRQTRALSNGCVRVQAVKALAARLLPTPEWTPDRLDDALATGATRTLSFAAPAIVRTVYETAQVQPDGSIRILSDIYNWDAPLVASLAGPGARSAPAPGLSPAIAQCFG